MSEPVVIRLPPLAGGQAESWRALIEIAPKLGRHWLLIGGQMVFLHEVEHESTDIRPTNDIDLVVDLRIDPAALEHTHTVLAGSDFAQDLRVPKVLRIVTDAAGQPSAFSPRTTWEPGQGSHSEAGAPSKHPAPHKPSAASHSFELNSTTIRPLSYADRRWPVPGADSFQPATTNDDRHAELREFLTMVG